MAANDFSVSDTADALYTKRLVTLQNVWWKRLLDVQAPYRWHIKSLKLGRCLDVGCGIGRNLMHLDRSSVGLDHNESSNQVCKDRGLQAFTPDQFFQTKEAKKESFDSILLAHVLEHMTFEDGQQLLREYLPFLKPGGRLVLITPQEAGYASDKSHIEFMPIPRLVDHLQRVGLSIERQYSYPFPLFWGKWFKYNENVVIGVR